MNKQALVFITLFSLILMLSIYYITSPIKPLDDLMVSDTVEGSIRFLQDKLEEKRTKLISDNSGILASASSTEADKKTALEVMEQLETSKLTEENMRSALLGLGFMSSFVEVEGNQMKVVVETDQGNMEEAAQIISVALSSSDRQYAVEVSFRLKK